MRYAELSLDGLLASKASKVRFKPLERYPSVSRDIAFVVKKEVSAKEILDAIHKAGSKMIQSTEIFDIYEGEHVEEGYKSVALRIIYQASDHTLTDNEIQESHNAVLKNLESKVKAQLRS